MDMALEPREIRGLIMNLNTLKVSDNYVEKENHPGQWETRRSKFDAQEEEGCKRGALYPSNPR